MKKINSLLLFGLPLILSSCILPSQSVTDPSTSTGNSEGSATSSPITPEEKYAIRWHMGFTEPKELYGTLGQAYKKYPLALLTFEADLEATYFYDI